MNYVKYFNLFGVDAKEIPCIIGEGVPDTATVADVGCFYMDETTGEVYKCTAVNDGVYTWGEILDENDKAEILEAINFLGFERGEFEPVNILEGMTLSRTQGAIWHNNMKLASTQYTTKYNAINELIDVISGFSYRIPQFMGLLDFYDENGNRTTLQKASGITDVEFTVAEGKTKLGISYMPSQIVMPRTIYRLTPTEEEINALKFTSDNFGILPQNITADNTKSLLAPLKDKVIVNFGDSIFGNARPPEDISTRLAELTGATVYNCGFGGCRMANVNFDTNYANYNAFCMANLATAIASKDFTAQETALTNTAAAAIPAYFTEALNLLKSIDFSKVDIITIAYGTNDFNGVIIDNESDKLSINTFGGALRYSIETILAAYPNVRIFICSQAYRFWANENEDSDTKATTWNGNTYTILDIFEKTIEVATEYKLPFIDNYYELGINKANRSYYIPENDGTHHNIKGRRLIAEHIAKRLF